jgi:hypothetical protein
LDFFAVLPGLVLGLYPESHGVGEPVTQLTVVPDFVGLGAVVFGLDVGSTVEVHEVNLSTVVDRFTVGFFYNYLVSLLFLFDPFAKLP